MPSGDRFQVGQRVVVVALHLADGRIARLGDEQVRWIIDPPGHRGPLWARRLRCEHCNSSVGDGADPDIGAGRFDGSQSRGRDADD